MWSAPIYTGGSRWESNPPQGAALPLDLKSRRHTSYLATPICLKSPLNKASWLIVSVELLKNKVKNIVAITEAGVKFNCLPVCSFILIMDYFFRKHFNKCLKPRADRTRSLQAVVIVN